jgi:hypothetical protein
MLWAMKTKTKKQTALPEIGRGLVWERTDSYSWAYHAGNFGGIDIHIEIEANYHSITPHRTEHAHYFTDYSAKEMKSFQKSWSHWDSGFDNGSRDHHTKKTKLDWSLVRVKLTPFVNSIQIEEEDILKDVVEVGYAPSANRIDAGDPVWITTDVALAEWVANNQERLESYALSHKPLAIKLLTESLEKLTK